MTNSRSFLGIVKTLLDRSDLAYKAYIKSGKTFLYAKILKESNSALRDVLINNTHLLPPEHTRNALALIHHIDVWCTVWEVTYESEKPALKSFFAFENEVNFPSKEVALLMDYYEKASA